MTFDYGVCPKLARKKRLGSTQQTIDLNNPILVFDFGDATKVFSDNGTTQITSGQPIQRVKSSVGSHTLTYNNTGDTNTRPVWVTGTPENSTTAKTYCKLVGSDSIAARGQLVSSYAKAGGEFTCFLVSYAPGPGWGILSYAGYPVTVGNAMKVLTDDRSWKPTSLEGSGATLGTGLNYDPLSVNPSTGVFPTRAYVQVFRVSATEKSIWYRGMKRAFTTSSPVAANNDIRIGDSGAKQVTLMIGELQWYAKALSDAQVATIAQTLDDKWGCGTWADIYPPTVQLSTPNPAPSTVPVTVTATFTEQMQGLTLADFTVTNGTAASFTNSGNNKVFTFTVTPTTAYTPTTVSIAANQATDIAGNGNSVRNVLSFTYISYNPATDSSLLAWYDPSDASTLFVNSDGTGAPQIGSTVGMMRNKAQNAYHMTQASFPMRPIRATTTNAIADSWLEYKAYPDRRLLAIPSTSSFFTNTGSRTIAYVAKQRYTSSPNPAPYTPSVSGIGSTPLVGFMVGANSATAPMITYHSNTPGYVRAFMTSSVSATIAERSEFFDNRKHVIQMRYSRDATTTTWDACFDAFRSTPNTISSTTLSNGFQIGGDSSMALRAFDGWIGELLVFSEYKTPEQQDEIQAYLKARWGTE